VRVVGRRRSPVACVVPVELVHEARVIVVLLRANHVRRLVVPIALGAPHAIERALQRRRTIGLDRRQRNQSRIEQSLSRAVLAVGSAASAARHSSAWSQSWAVEAGQSCLHDAALVDVLEQSRVALQPHSVACVIAVGVHLPHPCTWSAAEECTSGKRQAGRAGGEPRQSWR
jgi:hypothetical protein